MGDECCAYHAPNTLGVVYERGLVGIYHDWCEGFSTYPRTYDFIHANGLFSLYDDKFLDAMKLFKSNLPMCPTHQPCSEWARNYMKYCICSRKDWISLILGIISVVSWGYEIFSAHFLPA